VNLPSEVDTVSNRCDKSCALVLVQYQVTLRPIFSANLALLLRCQCSSVCDGSEVAHYS